MKEKKEHSKSLRMTETVRKYVEAQDGEGFNEKFENMVIHVMKNKEDIEKNIRIKEQQLNNINSEITRQQNLLNDIENMRKNLEYIFKKAATLANSI